MKNGIKNQTRSRLSKIRIHHLVKESIILSDSVPVDEFTDKPHFSSTRI